MNEKILIVEDDEEIAMVIKEYLEKSGYYAVWASTGREGIDEFKNEEFQLCIIDIMMPEMDGFELCKNIRLKSQVPIIIVSAKSGDLDKVKGLRIGADDYITKPFSLIEIEARVQSHLRRYKMYNQIKNENIWQYKGELEINEDDREVRLKGEDIHITQKEFEILIIMAQNPRRTFTKRELYECIWNEEDIEGNNTVTVHIKSLREKLKDNPKNPRFIETVWGIGYKFIGERL